MYFYAFCALLHIIYILLILIENGKGFTSSVATKLYCTVYYIKLHIFICFKMSRPYLVLNIKSPGYILWQKRSSYLPAAKLSCQVLCVFWQDNFYYFQSSNIFNNLCINLMLRQYISKLVLYEICDTLAKESYNSNLVPLSFKICPFIYKIYNILEKLYKIYYLFHTDE